MKILKFYELFMEKISPVFYRDVPNTIATVLVWLKLTKVDIAYCVL